MISFIKTERAKGRGIKAVAANATAPDCEGIVNLCVSGLTLDDGAVLRNCKSQYYAGGAVGLFAGTSARTLTPSALRRCWRRCP